MKNLLTIALFLIFFASAHAGIKADLIVAQDGSGNVKTVSEAISKVPENNKKRFTIFIKKGVYNEQIRIIDP